MNITAVVDQLLESPLHEADDMFISEVKDISVMGGGVSVVGASLLVKWRADSEYRSWGINNIEPVIETVTGWIEIETIEDQPKTSTIKIEGFAADGKVEKTERDGVSLYPRSAEINLRSHSVLVRF